MDVRSMMPLKNMLEWFPLPQMWENNSQILIVAISIVIVIVSVSVNYDVKYSWLHSYPCNVHNFCYLLY